MGRLLRLSLAASITIGLSVSLASQRASTRSVSAQNAQGFLSTINFPQLATRQVKKTIPLTPTKKKKLIPPKSKKTKQ